MGVNFYARENNPHSNVLLTAEPQENQHEEHRHEARRGRLRALALSATPALAGKGGSAGLDPVAPCRPARSTRSSPRSSAPRGLMCEECIADDDEPHRGQPRSRSARSRPGGSRSARAREDHGRAVEGRPRDRRTRSTCATPPTSSAAFASYSALPHAASRRSSAPACRREAKLAIVRAVGFMAHLDGNAILTTAMADSDADVRAAAVIAWRDVLGQLTRAADRRPARRR